VIIVPYAMSVDRFLSAKAYTESRISKEATFRSVYRLIGITSF